MERNDRPLFETPAEAAEGPVSPEEHAFNVVFCVVLAIVCIVCALFL